MLLSSTEFQILQVLLDQPGQLYSKAEIYAQIWGGEIPLSTNLLAVHIGNLRNKLFKAGGYELIRTARGFGYAMKI